MKVLKSDPVITYNHMQDESGNKTGLYMLLQRWHIVLEESFITLLLVVMLAVSL